MTGDLETCIFGDIWPNAFLFLLSSKESKIVLLPFSPTKDLNIQNLTVLQIMGASINEIAIPLPTYFKICKGKIY